MGITFDDDSNGTNKEGSGAPNQPTTIVSVANTAVSMKEPQESDHWTFLDHRDGDAWIHTLEELKDKFRFDVLAHSRSSENESKRDIKNNGGRTMAVWSCVLGYCEALATHKEASRRYRIFPIPIDALVRLVEREFWSRVLDPAKAAAEATATSISSMANTTAAHHQEVHRSLVRAVANAVWDTAPNSSKADEEHANSIYVCLRGSIDKKGIDCLGSSVATVAGMLLLQEQQHQQQSENNNGNEPMVTTRSMLTLSEDHAYERHIVEVASPSGKAIVEGTCEVAIPGSTKRQKAKRACEIAATFRDKKACVLLTPETSWLYMAKHPVVCSTVPMSLVPIVADVNCNIRRRGTKGGTGGTTSLESRQLYTIKRELLWILYDEGAMAAFPFGQMELGDCEGAVGSSRGEEWIKSKSNLLEHTEPILRNEELFLEAIRISQDRYEDAQVYPYYYAGHYHKDAGNKNVDNDEEDDNEHRFADALEMYSEAARVTSTYRFDTGDCLQLNKHLTSVATLINEDILTTVIDGGSTRLSRAWRYSANATTCCFWLLRFLDHLLRWEEHSSEVSGKAGLTSKNPRFVEILQISHKCFVGKLFQTFDQDVRSAALDRFWTGQNPPKHTIAAKSDETIIDSASNSSAEGASKEKLSSQPFPVSKRLGSSTTLLAKSFRAAKIQVRDIDLTILDDDDDGGDGGRRGRSSKRRRRS